ncbi:MAG: T9SS type A sorting domain-containing protein [Bacteroidetes bacterium]|nr:T9SS type A sorting domain-containing protein [Bacteroidota bacterium]
MKKPTFFVFIIFFNFIIVSAQSPCLPEGIIFTTQAQIDSFQVNYPGCTDIGWHTSISGPNIENLLGLSVLNSIGGNLHIWETSLTNLNGLEGIEAIFSFFIILNNPFLKSLSGLENLTFTGSDFWIVNNDSLTDLSGLVSIIINPGLKIAGNGMLSECDIQSICDYLASPNEPIIIENNAPGCNSQQEVEEACELIRIEDQQLQSLSITPNPIESNAVISFYMQKPSPVFLLITDMSGRKIICLTYELHAGEQSITFDASSMKPGIYFCTLKTNPPAGGQTKKIIKLK